MTDPTPKNPHPGMLGDGTEEQNLNQPGDPSLRISEAEVDEAFGEGETPNPPQPDDAPSQDPEPAGDPDVENGQVGDPEPEDPATI